MTIPQALNLALQHHQAGRISEAEALYHQILAVQPKHADALHYLGVIAHQTGLHDVAIRWIRQSIAINPNNPVAQSNLGEACRAVGRLDGAMAAYRRALQLKPDFPEAHNNLGIALRDRGQLHESVAAYRRAILVKPDYLEAYNNLGNALMDLGQIGEALAAYRHALGLKSEHPQTHNNLGNALRSQGQLDEAISSYRRALKVKPDFPEAHNNLGSALKRQGQLAEAILSFRRALQIKPAFPEAHNNLGIALSGRGQLDEAIAAYRRAVELKPDYMEAHNNLGIALRKLGRLDEAMTAYHRALELHPGHPETLNNLGNAIKDRGELDEAITVYRRALEHRPDHPEACSNLGNALGERGRLGEAVAVCRRALGLKPDYPEAYNNLGLALAGQRQLHEAIAAYRRALEIEPDFPEANNNLGLALAEQRQIDEAISSYRRALKVKPDFPEAYNNLGTALARQGQLDEAIAVYRRALKLKPGQSSTHSNLIYTLHFHPGYDGTAIAEEHRRWDRQFGDPLKSFVQAHANDRSPDRRLRVGYISPDFRDHAVGRFALPLFERHDSEKVEILCYSGSVGSDWMTERFRTLASEWRNTVGVSDARLAEMIREDEVDILLDLAMHSAGNRLLVFARQPAPVQVSWLAYPGSTGLRSIGYRLTDAHMDPPGEKRAWSSEAPMRLPDSWCCYQPMGNSPEVNKLPALSAEAVTFGSLNNFAKVNEGVLGLWARVLDAVKRSRLLMLCPEGQTRERVRGFFSTRGLGLERLEFFGFLPPLEYLRLYQRIDLALDPFPCNGMTTTCDALWMGVPVLTLPREMPASRAGLSLLSTVGLGEFAASSEDDYVRIAVELAGDLPRLAELRATMRQRMQASPLMDAPRFARNVEAAYRSIWECWCAGQSLTPEDL